MAGFSFHPHRGLFGTFDQPSFRVKTLSPFAAVTLPQADWQPVCPLSAYCRPKESIFHRESSIK
jgi:hypothetical protein